MGLNFAPVVPSYTYPGVPSMGNDIMNFGAPAAPAQTPSIAGIPIPGSTTVANGGQMSPQARPEALSTTGEETPENWFGKIGGLEGISSLLSGFGDLAGIYGAFKQLGLAKDQLDFSKETYNTNLANQTQSYNTALSDRVNSQYVTEGKSQAEADAYLAKNSL